MLPNLEVLARDDCRIEITSNDAKKMALVMSISHGGRVYLPHSVVENEAGDLVFIFKRAGSSDTGNGEREAE